MKKTICAAILFAMAIPCSAQQSYTTGNIEFGFSKASPMGKYKKYWSDAKSDYGSGSLSDMSFRVSAGFPMSENTDLGIDVFYFGASKANSSEESEKETVTGAGVSIKHYFSKKILSNGKIFGLYAKVGIGEYIRSYEYKLLDSGDQLHPGDMSKNGFGYNAAIGASFSISQNFTLGAEYRIDKAADKMYGANSGIPLELPAFEASSAGIFMAYRFSSGNASESIQQTDTTVADSTANSSADNAAEKQTAASPTADATQKNDVNTAKPAEENEEQGVIKAYNPKPGNPVTQLDKTTYIAEADKILENIPQSGKLGIPPVGVLFKIGQSELLPYYNEMLNKFIDIYVETDGTATILIEGFSSNANNETVKDPQLSKKRAQSVANYLIRNGIPASLIEVKAYGNKQANRGIFNNDSKCTGSQCYRRVNISIK